MDSGLGLAPLSIGYHPYLWVSTSLLMLVIPTSFLLFGAPDLQLMMSPESLGDT